MRIDEPRRVPGDLRRSRLNNCRSAAAAPGSREGLRLVTSLRPDDAVMADLCAAGKWAPAIPACACGRTVAKYRIVIGPGCLHAESRTTSSFRHQPGSPRKRGRVD